MDMTLKLLLSIYSIILVVNAISTLVLWKQSDHKLYKIALIVWTSCLLNFILQGFFQNFDLPMLMAFSTYIVTSLALFYFVKTAIESEQADLVLNEKPSMRLSFGFILLAFGVTQFTKDFVFPAALVAIGIALPMFKACYLIYKLKARRTWGLTSLGILVFLNAIHFLDYPFVRTSPTGALVGFSIALMILFSLSIFIQAFIVHQVTSSYSKMLKAEVDRQTEELSTLAHDNRTLLSVVCHDIANPLTVMKYSFEKLCRQIESGQLSEIKPQTTKIMRSIDFIVMLLSKVRDLQSVRIGKANLNLEPVNVKEIVYEVVGLYEDIMLQKNIQIEITGHMEDYLALGDSMILKSQILGNLISNAIKFSEPNSKITIYLSDSDKSISISIRDHGIGIPKDILSNLFSFESKTSRMGTANEKGTGLGMPLVKTYLEMMNGEIHVQSVEKTNLSNEQGSVFEVILPKAS